MDIAFLYIAEAYQCYHGAAIALELASRPGVRVRSFHNDPETPAVLERIHRAYEAPPAGSERLRTRPATRALQRIRRLGMQKTLCMFDNRAVLNRFDAVVAVEDTVALARRVGITRPKLIYYPHGYGDRARGFAGPVRRFDHVLLSGPRIAARMLEEGLVRPDNHSVVGPVKLETGARIGAHTPLGFGGGRPVVLYNAHKAPGLSSWDQFVEPMLAGFAAQDRFALVVAPHVKMFRRRSAATRAAWTARGMGNILVDVESGRLLDMSYTSAADIYVGDVSSQVYEFLARPRPCVFLNPSRIAWRDDPSFAHWHLGEVVEEPEALMPAIARAQARHGEFRERQIVQATASLGSLEPTPSVRAADAILDAIGRA
ncbi:hypothetical protein NFI95_09100 [Acetobacteraceae bacterium KSS8]|uniref:Glycosyl transferase n=1 Tax=Endosaccharibacter trunci TaxID=2812733 RepID=A0ABT1W6X2_9PROT|nr:hypothetical protein [Acetobacteraceae bacterium KSS8]